MTQDIRETSSYSSSKVLHAAEVMTPNPVSIHDRASIEEAVSFLVDTGYSAAPVIDIAGRPVGVISRTDIVVYDRNRLLLPDAVPYYFETDSRDSEDLDSTRSNTTLRVADIMTPSVYSVAPETSLDEVANQMLDLNVHRLFVVDDSGILIGVISTLDLLRHMRA